MEKDDTKNKNKSLSDLRSEIDDLEKQITESKRKERIILEEGKDLNTIYEWKAPERSFDPKDRKWYIVVSGVALVFILAAILLQTYLLVVAILAILTVLFAMNTVVPPVFDYEITNKGIRMGEKMYIWKQIPSFWITERGKDVFLNFEVSGKGNERLMILVGDGNINIITTELIRYIDYLTPEEVKRDILMNFTEGRHKRIEDIYSISEKQKKSV